MMKPDRDKYEALTQQQAADEITRMICELSYALEAVGKMAIEGAPHDSIFKVVKDTLQSTSEFPDGSG